MVLTANNPQTGNDTQIGLQMIPNRKYDPRCGPQMIPPENEEWHGVITIIYYINTSVLLGFLPLRKSIYFHM